jgi:hypothetical protein
MNTEEEKCLAIKAKEQLSYCCESACDKIYTEAYIEKLEMKIKELKNIIEELKNE